jgi:hypothetical protein
MRGEIVLSSAFQVRVDLRRYYKEYTYIANVTTVNGNVGGGGSRVGRTATDGIRFTVRNTDSVARSYGVTITLYKSLKKRLVARTISLASETAKPGQSVEVDVKLERGEKAGNMVLDEFIVINPSENKRVTTHATNWNLQRVAFAQMPIWLRLVRLVVNGGLWAIAAAFALLILILLASTMFDGIGHMLR